MVNCSFHYSSALCKTRTLLGVPAQTVEKKHRMASCSNPNFVSTVFVAQFNFLEKIVVNRGLTTWNTARPRSRAPLACRRSAWRPCAARSAFRRLGVRAGQVPPPRGTSRRSPSRLSPRNASPSPGSACRAVPPPRAQRYVVCSPAERACRAGAVPQRKAGGPSSLRLEAAPFALL
jgi:hypothetical protein